MNTRATAENSTKSKAKASAAAQQKKPPRPVQRATKRSTKQSAAKSSAHQPARQPALPGPLYAQRADAMQLADDIAARNGLQSDWVRSQVGAARYLPTIAKLVQPPPTGTPKNWAAYRSRFIDARRIAAGVSFWKTYQTELERAQAQTGVPAQIIVGILGVETIYGQQMGSFRVLDALATLALDFPATHPKAAQRTEFFRGELEQFMVLSQKQHEDPATYLGSFAGAMGLPQFMPSSELKYALDFDGDGRVDLRSSAPDAIGSVANYFKAFGWKEGMPSYYPVSFDASKLDKPQLLAADILPTFDVERFTALGAILPAQAQGYPGKLALIELQNGGAPNTYVAGTENFYVVTRYNWSAYYAMAVIDLGEEVARALNR